MVITLHPQTGTNALPQAAKIEDASLAQLARARDL